MNIIKTGNKYKIYQDSLQVFQKLAPGYYTICCNQDEGFFIADYNKIKITEKTYGIHTEKVNKIITSFDKINRNLGIILSGDKGIGKSLFAKMVAVECVYKDIPVIIVDTYYPGIASYINNINQTVCILFDEFDKTFGGYDDQKGGIDDPQTEMLSLFDGVSQGKKMFIITCNTLTKLNNYLVNRPGRFHYHFRFDYPDKEAITEYLIDNNIPKEEIDNVIAFASKIPLNYDCLRSIAFELGLGYSFKEAIKDLNILNMQDSFYEVYVYFEDGEYLMKSRCRIDFFNNSDMKQNIYFDSLENDYNTIGRVEFNIKDVNFDPILGYYYFDDTNAKWILEEYLLKAVEKSDEYGDNEVKLGKKWKPKKFNKMIIRSSKDRTLHYDV